MNQFRAWTTADEDIIRAWYGDESKRAPRFIERLAVELSRSAAAVAVRASRLGLGDFTRKVPAEFRAPPKGSRAKYSTKEERADALRQRFAEHGHPRGYLGRTHSSETRAKLSAKVRAAWADPTSRLNAPEFLQARADRMTIIAADRVRNGSGNPYSRARRGRRADLGETFFRSGWEANYARYLNILLAKGTISAWTYEPETFWFEAIRRGVRSYTPDFRVLLPDGSHEWHEVKGWMDAKSKTKLQRMKKYHPAERIVLIEEAFFKQCERSGFAGTVPHWEFKRAG